MKRAVEADARREGRGTCFAVALPPPALMTWPSYDLLAVIMNPRGSNLKPPPCIAVLNRPAGEGARDLGRHLSAYSRRPRRACAAPSARARSSRSGRAAPPARLHSSTPSGLRAKRLANCPRSGTRARDGPGVRDVDRSGSALIQLSEVEEHRWALGGRPEQIAELAEHAGRIASRSYSVSMKRAWPLRASTLKWLNQKSVRTSWSCRSL